MTELTFHFPVTPQPKLRPRLNKCTGFVHTPQKTINAAQELQAYAIRQLPKGWKPSPHPAVVMLSFYFERPKSASVKKRPKHTVKPDIDNLIKMVMDSLNKIVWVDDTQVYSISAQKHYGSKEGIMMIVDFEE